MPWRCRDGLAQRRSRVPYLTPGGPIATKHTPNLPLRPSVQLLIFIERATVVKSCCCLVMWDLTVPFISLVSEQGFLHVSSLSRLLYHKYITHISAWMTRVHTHIIHTDTHSTHILRYIMYAPRYTRMNT